MSDQCALDASGSLLDAKDIVFYESESDTRPIPKPTANVPTQAPVHEGEHFNYFISLLYTINMRLHAQVEDAVQKTPRNLNNRLSLRN
jgi:hypothetical protein